MFKDYYQVRDWLEQFIPFTYGKEQLGLKKIEYLLALLGNPEKKFKSIHVAGTSGKGSTAYYIAKLLQSRGPSSPLDARGKLRARGRTSTVGLHISPHLVDIRERMMINGKLIELNKFIKLIEEVRVAVEKIQKEKPELTPSYFEILVASSFLYFAKEKVDLAVVEVGLGGRLDATNVLLPEVSVITNIGLDHTDILGKTIDAIAYEKAGIIKSKVKVESQSVGSKASRTGIPVVTGASGRAFEVIADVAKKRQAPLITIDTRKTPIGMQDEPFWQAKMLAIEAVELSLREALRLRAGRRSNLVKDRFASLAMTDVGLPGRLEEIDENVILDGAHNPDKVRFLIQNFRGATSRRARGRTSQILLVLAFKKGKDWKKMVDLLLKNLPVKAVIATKYQAATDTGFGSAVEPEEIRDYVTKVQSAILRLRSGRECKVISNSQEAVFEALQSTVNCQLSTVLVTGSLYLVGEARTMWKLPDF